MNNLLNAPHLLSLLCFFALWSSSQLGTLLGRRIHPLKDEERDTFGVIQAAVLTMLGLLVGFTFSMAVSRYDQRKLYEESEANAIGTEYVRAGLLPAADSATVRNLLSDYLDQRILFYQNPDERQLGPNKISTAKLQAALWASVQTRAFSLPTPIVALTISGMNDVLNSQGYTQFAWGNRIPLEAWALLAAIAICCNLLIGYGARRMGRLLSIVMPLAISISFFLISDIDSPRGGLIRVQPQNLISLSHSFQAH